MLPCALPAAPAVARGCPIGGSTAAVPRRAPPRPAARRERARTAAAAADKQQRRVNDADSLADFVASHSALAELLGDPRQLVAQQLLDGVINVVYKVQGPGGGAVIVKQALPYVRAVGETFPLSRERMDVEAAAMELVHSCCPQHVPRLLAFDAAHSVLAMQCVPHQKLLYCIRGGQVLPDLARQLAELLSSSFAHTDLQLLQHEEERAAMLARFANTDIVAANERVVLQAPFDAQDASNRWTSPALDADVHAMWADAEVQASAAAILDVYRTRKEALIHNDLHAGNLLAGPGSLFLIDWEFATIGPITFDLGCLMGNIMLAVLSLRGMAETQQQQQQQQQQQEQQQEQQQQQPVAQVQRLEQAEWLLQVLQEVWRRFVALYPARLQQERAAAIDAAAGSSASNASCAAANAGPADAGCEAWQRQLLADSCGFAGCCLIRLTVGIHHYPDIQALPDDGTRAGVERACLRLGQQLLLLRARSELEASDSGEGSCSSAAAGSGSAAQPLSIGCVQQLVREACGPWLQGQGPA